MIAEKKMPLPLPSETTKRWRQMAAAFGLYVEHGPYRGRKFGHAIRLMERLGDAYEADPEAVLNAIRPFVQHDEA